MLGPGDPPLIKEARRRARHVDDVGGGFEQWGSNPTPTRYTVTGVVCDFNADTRVVHLVPSASA
jgi:hypothetical protein